MSLVSQTIKNLKGGISQQPDILRYEDQGHTQINAFSSEVEGLQKRPPSVHVARLGNQESLGARPLCHVIHRDSTEQYGVFFTTSDIKVLDLLTGDWVTVNAPNGFTYATSGKNPRDDLRCVTVADYTFVINRSISCLEGSARTPQYYNPEANALVVCAGGQYSRTFNIDRKSVV